MFFHFETHCNSCGEEEEYIAGGVVSCARCGQKVTILFEKEYVHVENDMESAVQDEID